jgi:hypothetical protein
MADTNFDIDQGTNFRLDCEVLDGLGDPIDITTALIIGQVRKTASNKTIEAEFVVEPTNLLLGQFAITLSAVATSKLKCNPSNSAQRIPTQFAYDVEIHYTDGTVNRILSGVFNVSPEVTRTCQI